MSYWSSTTKTLRKIGGVWVDPVSVDAAEVGSSGKTARLHLRGGDSVDIEIPEGRSLDWLVAQLFKEDK